MSCSSLRRRRWEKGSHCRGSGEQAWWRWGQKLNGSRGSRSRGWWSLNAVPKEGGLLELELILNHIEHLAPEEFLHVLAISHHGVHLVLGRGWGRPNRHPLAKQLAYLDQGSFEVVLAAE